MSSILFKIAVDFIFNEINDPQFANAHGYSLYDDLDSICLTGFADDQTVTSKSLSSASHVVKLIQNLFQEIGLFINPTKSSDIKIIQGKLLDGILELSNNENIQCNVKFSLIKYLGCTFINQIVFDPKTIKYFNINLEKITTSHLLKPDQKINIINQYIFPMLIYPLQCAPLYAIPKSLTSQIDLMIRRSVKAIIGLSASTTNEMFYAPRNLRGLGLLKTEWEVQLQHFSIAKKISSIEDLLISRTFDSTGEMKKCQSNLNV